MIAAVLLALAVAAGPPPQDTLRFPLRESVIRLYTDCDETRWPWGVEESFVLKTNEELAQGVERLRALEAGWRRHFAERAGDSITPTPLEQWTYPLAVRGRLLNNYFNPREGGPHGALDIFVQREGAIVRAPVSGVVIASGDNWRGGWARARGGLWYEGGGLSRRAGNGLIIFDVASGGYVYVSHLAPGLLVGTGDVVRAGQPVGRVGHTGNASQPGHGKHVHFAFKRPGTGCGFDGVLVSENPYPQVREARRRMGR
jgi:murein DD-endopeptidase MepM/ murein hydrolase activator NlpD